MSKSAVVSIKLVSIALSTLGFFGFSSGCLVSSGLIAVGSNYELPLGDVKSIAVDSQGRIYCAVEMYSRVQQYDSDGRFLRSWLVPANRGTFRLRVNDTDELEVYVSRGSTLFTFDAEGRLVRSSGVEPDIFHEFAERTAMLPGGEELKVSRCRLVRCIVERDVQGNNHPLIVSRPEWLVAEPIPAWLLFAGGLTLYEMARKASQGKKRPGRI